MNSDDPELHASVIENQLYSQDAVITTSILITVLACPLMVGGRYIQNELKISQSRDNER